MNRLFILFVMACCLGRLSAQQMEDASKYDRFIRQSIYRDYKGMLRPPAGAISHPFIVPGSVYSNQLWDWDSWLSSIALTQILYDEDGEKGRQEALSYGEGCVLNFLQYETADGAIPIMVQAKNDPQSYLSADADKTNMHKPVLAQHAAFLTKLNQGDAEWLRDAFPKLEAFLKNYDDHRRNQPTGLYCWQDDFAIGVDNDPCTFFRPPDSSGSIYLNCLMYKELKAMAYLASCLKLTKVTSDNYEKKAEDLKTAIQKYCWDERDGFYYSVDLGLMPITNKPRHYMGADFVLHSGHPRDYDCLIQRIEVWSGFMAMWAGIATPEQAKRMVDEHLKNQKTLGAPYGVRSLSKMEKMYGLYASGNPSNWDGPIWGISNYMVFKGLLNYGFTRDARSMADKTIKLFGQDYEKSKTLHEYYNPDTGEPIENPGFQNWNYLVLNMIDWSENRPVMAEF